MTDGKGFTNVLECIACISFTYFSALVVYCEGVNLAIPVRNTYQKSSEDEILIDAIIYFQRSSIAENSSVYDKKYIFHSQY